MCVQETGCGTGLPWCCFGRDGLSLSREILHYVG